MAEDVVELDMSEGSHVSTGATGRHTETSLPVQQKDDWKGVYTNPFKQNKHILLYDMYEQAGGFARNIPDTGSDCTYTYCIPITCERQFRPRAVRAPNVYYYPSAIDSTVKPVYSQAKVVTSVKRGDTDYDDLDIKRFMRDATGRKESYNKIQQRAMTNLKIADIAFHAMTKAENATIPSISEFRSIDLILNVEDSGEREQSIVFYRGNYLKADEGGNTATRYAQAIEFYMENGYCWVQNWEGEWGSCIVGDWADVDWERSGEPKNTEIDEMVVYVQRSTASPTMDMLPETPSSYRLCMACLDVYQMKSLVGWTFALTAMPTPYMYGSMKGLLYGMSQAIEIEPNPVGTHVPAPAFMSPDAGLLKNCNDHIEAAKEDMREVAKEGGINTTTGQQAQSADSKSYEFQATEEKCRGTVNDCGDFDEWAFPLFDKYMKRKEGVYTYTRSYPSQFYPDKDPDITELIEGVTLAFDQRLPVVTNTLMGKLVFALTKGDITDDEKLAVREELEARTVIDQPDGGGVM